MTPFTTEFQRVTLEVIKYRLTKAIHERELFFAAGNIDASAMIDQMSRSLVAELTVFMLKGRTSTGSATESVTFPADWWQVFKERWFKYRLTRWLTRRYPVRYTTVKVPTHYEITRVCPHVPIPQDAAKNRRLCVEFLTNDGRS